MLNVRFSLFLVAALAVGEIGCGGSGGGGGSTTPLNPHPFLTTVAPANAMVGSAAIQITATGSQYISGSQIEWDGSPLNTTYVSSTSLQAQVSADRMAQPGFHQITVVTPPPGGGGSPGPLTFAVVAPSGTGVTALNVQASDVVWDPQSKKLYASIPSSASSYANSIAVIDPTTGTVSTSISGLSEPDLLAISDDSQYLYAGIDGSAVIERFALPDLSPDISIPLGSNSVYGPYHAGSLEVAPGDPHTTAVGLAYEQTPGGFGVIYDDATPRSSNTPFGGQIMWGADANSLYTSSDGEGGSTFSSYAVNSSGVTLKNEFGDIGPLDGVYCHFDRGQGVLYDDAGFAMDPTSGTVRGFYYPNYIYLKNIHNNVLISDSQLDRVFVAGQTPDQYNAGRNDYTIEAFDATHFTHLASIVIPGLTGSPIHLKRWGTSGLALTTGVFPTFTASNLYLIDGPFVNPDGQADSTIGTDYGAVATITGISPEYASAGSASLTITVTGRGFNSGSVVNWNGQAISTGFVNSTKLQVQVPGGDLATSASNVITVSNPSSYVTPSNALTFSVLPQESQGTTIAAVNLASQDLAWDPAENKLYVSILSFDINHGNSIAVVNPATATVESSPFAGSEPILVRVASSGMAYVGYLGSDAVQQFTLPQFAPGMQWGLGAEVNFLIPYFPLDLQVMPGAPHTTAISTGLWPAIPQAEGGIAIYDNNVVRPVAATGNGGSQLYDSLQWGPSATTLYALNNEAEPQNDFYALSVDGSGVSLANDYPLAYDNDYRIHFDPGTGYMYEDNGRILDPSNGTIVGSILAVGYAVPDSSVNRVFFLEQGAGADLVIQAFDQTSFVSLGTITIPNVVGGPVNFARCGTSCLAFTTFNPTVLDGPIGSPFDSNESPGMLYIVNSSLFSSARQGAFENTSPPLKEWKRHFGILEARRPAKLRR